jgi:hypothetical protein
VTRNMKLEHLVARKAIRSVESSAGTSTVTFDDGARMTIQGTAPDDLQRNVAITEVWQHDTILRLGFADGTTSDVTLAAETSSVLLRDASGGFVYSD